MTPGIKVNGAINLTTTAATNGTSTATYTAPVNGYAIVHYAAESSANTGSPAATVAVTYSSMPVQDASGASVNIKSAQAFYIGPGLTFTVVTTMAGASTGISRTAQIRGVEFVG